MNAVRKFMTNGVRPLIRKQVYVIIKMSVDTQPREPFFFSFIKP